MSESLTDFNLPGVMLTCVHLCPPSQIILMFPCQKASNMHLKSTMSFIAAIIRRVTDKA